MGPDKSDSTLVLICKQPRPGYGKQRLAASIGEQRALQIAEALLDCTLADAETWPGPIVISPASAEESEWAHLLMRRPMLNGAAASVEVQCDGNLGQRLQDMDTRVRNSGTDNVILIGSDAPTLSARHFDEATDALHHYDVVLADCADGGVSIMGSRTGWPPLDNLPWSTPELGNALASACSGSGRNVCRFDGGHDLDDEGDIAAILQLLENDTRPTRRALVATLR